MSAGRFFVDPVVLAMPEPVLPPDIAQQVRQVLRLRVGDEITLLDGVGLAYHCQITVLERDRVCVRVIQQEVVPTEPRHRLTLAQGLLKAAKFEWVIQKGTEIGVTNFVPFACQRSVSGLEEASTAKRKRWQIIAKEAAEQSERGVIPEIVAPLPLRDLCQQTHADLRLIAWEEATHEQTIASAVYTHAKASHESITALLAIGPEGGLTPDEIAHAVAHGFQVVSLGRRTLRAETAAIVGSALVLHALGDLG